MDNIDIDKYHLENIDIDKDHLENIDIDIDKNIRENIDINIDIYEDSLNKKNSADLKKNHAFLKYCIDWNLAYQTGLGMDKKLTLALELGDLRALSWWSEEPNKQYSKS